MFDKCGATGGLWVCWAGREGTLNHDLGGWSGTEPDNQTCLPNKHSLQKQGSASNQPSHVATRYTKIVQNATPWWRSQNTCNLPGILTGWKNEWTNETLKFRQQKNPKPFSVLLSNEKNKPKKIMHSVTRPRCPQRLETSGSSAPKQVAHLVQGVPRRIRNTNGRTSLDKYFDHLQMAQFHC